jgi:hypothetical protein
MLEWSRYFLSGMADLFWQMIAEVHLAFEWTGFILIIFMAS